MINYGLIVGVSFDFFSALYKIDLQWLIIWGDAGANRAHTIVEECNEVIEYTHGKNSSEGT